MPTMKLERFTRADWVVAALGVLLAIDLLFLPWFHISVTVGPITLAADSSATGAPDGLFGVLALLAVIALLADLAVERLVPDVEIPPIGGSRAMTRQVAAFAAAALLAVKFGLHIDFGYFGVGFYGAAVLAAALVYYTRLIAQGA
jgi:hypothetical protein